MQDREKPKAQLLGDIREMRKRLAALEVAAKNHAEAVRPDAQSGEIERASLSLFESNPHPMWVYDQEALAFLAVNDAAIAQYGYQREEFLAMTIKDIRPEKDVPRLLDLVAKPLEGLKETGSWQHRKKDGTIIDVEITSHSLVFAGRKARLVLAQDITARKQADEALRESEQRFKILAEASFEGIALSEKGVLLDVNEQLANMLGYERHELIGKPATEFIAPEHRELVKDAILEKRLAPYEHLMIRKNGAAFPVEIRARMAHIGGREVRLTAIRDITERKRTEERLRRSEELLQRSQHIAHVGSWELDIVNNTLLWSNEIYRIFEIDPDKFGASYEAFLESVHPEDRETVNRAYQDSVKSREPYDIVHRLLLPDGRVKFVQERCETFYDPGGNPVRSIGAVQDITERRLAEEDLRQLSRKNAEALRVAHMGHWEFDVKTGLFTFNDQYYSLHGTTASQAGGYLMTAEEFARRYVHPDDAHLVGLAVRQAIEATDPDFEFQIEARILRCDGAVRWVTVWFRLEKDKQGRTVKMYGVNQDITKRKQAEEALHERNRYIETILENAPIGFAVNTIHDGRGVFVSGKFEDIYGVPRGSINTVDEYFEKVYLDPVFRDQIRERILTDMASGDASRMRWEDIPITTIAGRKKFVTAFNIPLVDQNLMVSTVQDVTERKQAEDAVRQSRETLEKTFRSLDSALFILDNGNPPVIIECNPAATGIFGYKKEEMLGQTTAFIHEDKEALAEFQMKIYPAIKEQGFLSSFEFQMKRRSGDIFPTEHSVFPLLDDLGNRTGWISVVRDITERKRAERQTRDALDFIRTMMESSPIGLVSIKATGAVVAVNRAISEITGGTTEQLLKQNVRDLEPWKNYGLLAVMDEALATNSERQIETYLVSTFGKRAWLSIRFVPYVFEGEPHVLALLTDISDRKRGEAEKEKLQAQLLQAQKMEAVGQLAGGIAHDFNNILTVIIGYGHLALRELREDDPVRAGLEEILLAGDRAAALTQSLLAFGRKQTINPQLIDLNSVINKVQKLLIRIIGEDIALRTTLSDEPLIIFTDAIQMEQVLLNLATNARDAMPDGGKLFIETQRVDVDDEYVKTHGHGEIGPYAMLTMTDTGGGIEPPIKEHIFEPFFTTKEKGKGTGLGLSIVYGIVKQHKGFITVYSEIGKGTSFKILFPISEVRASDVRSSESPAVSRRGTETVLLAEDDASVRALNKRILEEFGYRVIEAVDGLDALEKLAQNRNDVQLLILDVIMPGKNGKEVYEAAKVMDPRIKALFTSGYPADLIQNKGVLEEGLHFITKPAGPRAFLEKIRSVLER